MKFPKLQCNLYYVILVFFVLFSLSAKENIVSTAPISTSFISSPIGSGDDKLLSLTQPSHLSPISSSLNSGRSSIAAVQSLTISSSASGNIFCIGDTVTISVSSTASVSTYEFYENTSLKLTTTSPTYTFNPIGNTTVSVIANFSGSGNSSETAAIFLEENRIDTGFLLGPSEICEGDRPSSILLSGGTNTLGTTYQWEHSTDGNTFTSIPVTNRELVFNTSDPWIPTVTTYYRVVIQSRGCQATTAPLKLNVIPKPTLVQTLGPKDSQQFCAGTSISPISFRFGGSATDLLISGITASGLNLTKVSSNTYTITGTPTADVGIRIQTQSVSNCIESVLYYAITEINGGNAPYQIRKGSDTLEATVFEAGGRWYNNALFQKDLTNTTFYATTTYTLSVSPFYEWKIDPLTAGVVDATTGNVVWNTNFSGTVTVSVRETTCSGSSNWLDTPIVIIPDTSSTSSSVLLEPEVLDLFIGGQNSGQLPECQTDLSIKETGFFTTTASGNADYSEIQWSLTNIVPGIGSVQSPGVINSKTGVLTWAAGFWGRFDVQAVPLYRNGGQGTAVSKNVIIKEQIESTPSIYIANGSSVPSCPTVLGQTTDFYSNDEVVWSLDNTNAGTIVETSSRTATMYWNPNFGGSQVRIIARSAASCDVGESSMLIFIPSEASILTSVVNPIIVCQGTNLAPLEFEVLGFPDTAVVSGTLPSGISVIRNFTQNEIDLIYGGSSRIANEEYRFELLGNTVLYTTTKANETADEFVQNVAKEINNSNVNFSASSPALNTLRITAKVAGVTLNGHVSYINGSIEVQNIQTVNQARKTISLTGTATAAPGIYDFKILSSGGNCLQAERNVQIIVQGTSSITLAAGAQQNQAICEGSAITPIAFDVRYARSAIATQLPSGLQFVFNSSTSQYELSGTPNVSVTNTTSYTYEIKTESNTNGCLPEATISGVITLYPKTLIQRTSAVGTDNQLLCISSFSTSSLTPIIYELSEDVINYSITPPLPNGLVYNRTNNTITISGVPSITTVSQTVYSYSIKVDGKHCASDEIKGTITIEAASISLISAPETAHQEGASAVCNGTPITPIIYLIKGAKEAAVTGLPAGVTGSLNGEQFVISGTPKVSTSSSTHYTYSLTTSGSTCLVNTKETGVIEIIPTPEIISSIIQANDIQHSSCNGGADGAIQIPTTSPEFENRFKGGQNARAQESLVSYTNNPALGDVYTIHLNKNSYKHTVIASSFGGPVQSLEEVVQDLVKIITSAMGSQAVSVTATVQNLTSIRLISDIPGTAFTVSPSINTTVSGSNQPTVTLATPVANLSRDFSFQWTGPNGFRSTDLSIEQLSAGIYNLEVFIGACSTQASFTIEEPEEISSVIELCNGSIKVTATGGVGPYKINLYNSNNQLIQTTNTVDSHLYTGLISGSDYRIEIWDSQCAVAYQKAIFLPFGLSFDSSIPLVVDDYCNDGDGDGFIELGGNSGGNAFSGGSNQYNYSWVGGPSGNFRATTRDIYNLEPGVYTVTVTDQNLGCSDQQSFTVGSVNRLVITPTSNTVFNSKGKIELFCQGDQTATIEVGVTGGVGNYTYSWLKNGVSMVGKTSPKIEKVGAGKYTVVVKDSPPTGISSQLTSCNATYEFEVVEPNPIEVILNSGTVTKTFCPGDDEVSFKIQILGGTPPFQVKLNNGTVASFSVPNNNTYTYSKIDPSKTGTDYTISVEDSNGCKPTATASLTLHYEAVESIEFKGTISPIDCASGNLGSIKLETISSTLSNPEDVQVEWISAYGHFYHSWESKKGVLEGIENGGNYQAIVTYKGCELFNQIFKVEDKNQGLFFNAIQVDGGGCNGELGSISIDIQGGVPPYSIDWEQYKVATTATISNTGSSSETVTTTSALAWVKLPQYTNNAAISGLVQGAYRAVVKDSSANINSEACNSVIVSDNINIGTSVFEIYSVELFDVSSCNSTETNAEIKFSILNTLPYPANFQYEHEILLDNKDPGTDLIRLNENVYKIIGVGEGSHTLQIKTGTTSQVLGEYADCSIVYSFTVEEQIPIRFIGQTVFDLDPCLDNAQILIDNSQISGGVPYDFGSELTYDLKWTFTPAEDTQNPNTNTQTFVGNRINNIQPGNYELIISDSLGCESEPINFSVNASEKTIPFTVSGNLQNNLNNGEQNELVKVLPPNCSNQTDGQIGIRIEGGLRPYIIEWFQEKTSQTESSTTVSYIPLLDFSNTTYLSNLAPGVYRLKITSQNTSCDSPVNSSMYSYYEEDFIVPKNDELYIVEGPNIDENLCQSKPGKLLIEVFDNQSGELNFYYNNELITSESQSGSNGNTLYTLIIENPVLNADLVVTNKAGCQVSTKIVISEIGDPQFSYTTPNKEAENIILAKEEVTFTNRSEPPYYSSEWNFGDGTDNLLIETTGLVAPIRHTYGIAGTYFVTLRNYSSLGCYKEYSEQIVIGRGYNIIAPNAFTPNGDLINDLYRVLFSGFQKVTFKVFNQNGDLLHAETVEQLIQQPDAPLQLNGWDGQNETGSSFYTYHFIGALITDQTEVTKTGNFVLIK